MLYILFASSAFCQRADALGDSSTLSRWSFARSYSKRGAVSDLKLVYPYPLYSGLYGQLYRTNIMNVMTGQLLLSYALLFSMLLQPFSIRATVPLFLHRSDPV